jgi:hypothetical protein
MPFSTNNSGLEVRQRRAPESVCNLNGNDTRPAVTPVSAAFAARHLKTDHGSGRITQQSPSKTRDIRNLGQDGPSGSPKTALPGAKAKLHII